MIVQMPTEYVTALTQTSQALMQQLGTALLTGDGAASDFGQYVRLGEVQQNYLQEMGALMVSSMTQAGVQPPAKSDKRFTGQGWQESPYHEFLKSSYLIHARYVNNLIDGA